MVRLASCISGLWLLAASALFAAPVDASAQTGTDKSVEDIDKARAAVAEALSRAPLGFRRVLFVSEIPEGFAAYQPRANNVFTPDEPLIVYTEPIGVEWRKDGDEFSSKLVVDFEIRSPDGKVLAGQKGFGEFALSAREPPLDFMTHVKLDVTGAAAGSYILGLTIHDTNSGKSTSTDLPFEIK
jgi:hypothetical protein